MLNVLLWLEYRVSVIKLVNKVPKQQEVKVSKVTVYKESLTSFQNIIRPP